MGSYLTAVESSKTEDLNTGDLIDHFSEGGSPYLADVASWSTHVDIVHEIWDEFSLLFDCEIYGKIKYADSTNVDNMLIFLDKKIRERLDNAENLIKNGIYEIEVLIDMIRILRDVKNKDKTLIFEWG